MVISRLQNFTFHFISEYLAEKCNNKIEKILNQNLRNDK